VKSVPTLYVLNISIYGFILALYRTPINLAMPVQGLSTAIANIHSLSLSRTMTVQAYKIKTTGYLEEILA
jgi:hypothetical protein